MYSTIAENTNLYAIAMNASTSRTATNSRYWQPTDRNEIRVFFGVLFYMGIHREPNYKTYWEVGKLEGPIHSISSHISLNRFENFGDIFTFLSLFRSLLRWNKLKNLL